jgi:hypothetical protein
MLIKSDKTFEDIVERIVALFRPQAQPAGGPLDRDDSVVTSYEAHIERTNPAPPPAPKHQTR